MLDASYFTNTGENVNSIIKDVHYYLSIFQIKLSTKFKLSAPLNELKTWIRSANLFDFQKRQVVVQGFHSCIKSRRQSYSCSNNLFLLVSEGQLEVALTSTPSSKPYNAISLLHSLSRLDGFEAALYTDSSSNSLLSVTVYNARGVLNGYIQPIAEVEDKNEDTRIIDTG